MAISRTSTRRWPRDGCFAVQSSLARHRSEVEEVPDQPRRPARCRAPISGLRDG
jgi:hypothetical protein